MSARRGQGRGPPRGGGRAGAFEEESGGFNVEAQSRGSAGAGRGPYRGGGRGRGGLQQGPAEQQGAGWGGGGRRGGRGDWEQQQQRSSTQDWRVETGHQGIGGGGGRGYEGGAGYHGRGGEHQGSGGFDSYDSESAGSSSGGTRGRGYYESEAGSSSSGSGSRGRRGRAGSYQAQGSWASPAPPLAELLPGFSGLSLKEQEATPFQEEESVEGGISIVPSSVSSSSSKSLVAPRRPNSGKVGLGVTVRANHFVVSFKPSDHIYQYSIEITPKISKAMARVLERNFISVHRSELGGKRPVYDGSKCMYTVGALPFDHRDFSVGLPDERAPSETPSGLERKFTVSVRHVATLNPNILDEFLSGRQASTPQEFLQALDVVLREHPSLSFIPVSRSFFKKDLGSADLTGGLVAWNGFYQSLRPTKQGLVLNVDLSTTAFHANIPVIDFLQQSIGRPFEPRQRPTDAIRSKIRKSLVRLKVQVVHRQTPRKYRIAGLSTIPTGELKFPLEGGEEMRVVDYFKLTYNYDIRYPNLPSLQVQANKQSYLPMEVCVICEGQKFGGKLHERQTTNLRALACLKPAIRERTVTSIMARDDAPGRGEFVSDFGLTVSTQLTVVRARLLPAPKLRYGALGQETEITPNMGAWNLMNSRVVEGGTVAYWALLNFDSRLYDQQIYDFIFSLSKRCNELGVKMARETVVPPVFRRYEDLDNPTKLENSLQFVHDESSQAIYKKSQGQAGHLHLLVCIMPDKHQAYGELKRICETQIGIVTQCCLSKHVNNRNEQKKSQYLANLALKVNAKVGGRNVTLAQELPRMCPILNQPTIIFGADVTHPHPGDDTAPSIAAVVANTDWPSANRYLARVRSQGHRKEIIENLAEMVKELWQKFCEKTGTRPERVIMFRDGVSEGQFDTVLQVEVLALKEALREVGGPDYKPLVTWAVVQKRHHTRLFPGDNNMDRSSNICPGTVVDTIITHPREFDFYLCSHAGIQGTSRPTHYHVLWDENGFKADDLQGLIYNLCYTYARCTRSVSVVPPAYYAHLAAYRARLHLESLGGSDTTSLRGGHSSAGGSTSRAAVPAVRALPRIQQNVQEVMYYC